MYAIATASASNSANDEHTKIVRDVDATKADTITNAFETEFHRTGVQAYLEYYQL